MILAEKPVPTFRDHAPDLLLVDDANEVVDLLDHATHCRRIRQLGDPADLVQLEPDQRRTLRMVAADRASGLLDLDGFCGLGHRLKTPKALFRASCLLSMI